METENQTSPLSAWPAPAGSLRAYHAMVKPIGSICNLNCTYCYYLQKKDLLGSSSKFRISDEILETHIRQYIEGQDRSEVVFFPGREASPRCWGWTFSAKWLSWSRNSRSRISDDLQTNGTILDDEWSAFLKKHGFLAGLSIDGPKERTTGIE
jgi:uncharacterized protein